MFRAIAPATTALQSLDNPGKHAPVIDPWHPTRIVRQERLNPRPLIIRNQKKSAINQASLLEARESHCSAGVNPVYGAGP